MEVNDEFLDEAVGVAVLVLGVILVLWKPAVLAVLGLVGLGAIVYFEARENENGGCDDNSRSTEAPPRLKGFSLIIDMVKR